VADLTPPPTVHVFYRATGALGEREIREAVAQLSADERARYERFRFAPDRRDYAAAHALLRTALSRFVPVPPDAWRFREDPGGKPSLVADPRAPALSFSLSHTNGLVACAITSGGDVGVDVEGVDRRVDAGLARRFFSESENRALAACPTDAARTARFLELWTLKEAYLKAIGVGLLHPLNTVIFTVDAGGRVRFSAPPGVDAARWRFRLFMPRPSYRLAVALRLPPECGGEMACSIVDLSTP